MRKCIACWMVAAMAMAGCQERGALPPPESGEIETIEVAPEAQTETADPLPTEGAPAGEAPVEALPSPDDDAGAADPQDLPTEGAPKGEANSR